MSRDSLAAQCASVTRKIAKNRTQMQKSTIELQAQALMDWTRFEVEAQEIRLEAQALRIRLEAQASTNYPRITEKVEAQE